jgi:hypothetical protein
MVLTMLAVPKAGMTQIHGIAQSPDGTRFAVLYQSNRALGAYPPGGPISMGIYSSATGALTRQWSFANPQHQDFVPGAPGESLDSNLEVSWTSDGRHLAFMDRTSSSIELRVLDVASQGNALFADARVVLVNKVQTSADIACQTFWLSSDERSVRCGALMPESTSAGAVLDAAVQRSPWTGCNAPASASYPGIIDIDLRSRKLVGVLYEVKPDCMGAANSRLLWVSPSGQTMLGLIGWNDDPSMTWHENLVLYSQGRATLLAHAAAVAMERADAFAF